MKFIRGLWGDPLVHSYAEAMRDAERTIKHGDHHPEPVVTYCFGRANQEMLERFGDKVEHVMDQYGMPNLSRCDLWKREPNGAIHWGHSMWRLKLLCICHAVRNYGEVVWLDWAEGIDGTLPDDFWDRMREGATLQASLTRYKQAKVVWRDRRMEKRVLPRGAFIYCRDQEVADRLVTLSMNIPHLSDEHVIALTIDEIHGGWLGVDEYKKAGHEPYCNRHPAQVHEPEIDLFKEHFWGDNRVGRRNCQKNTFQ